MTKWVVILILIAGTLILLYNPPVFVDTYNTPYSEGWKAKPGTTDRGNYNEP